MDDSDVKRARTAAMGIAASLHPAIDDVVVLHNSNKLTLRLLPHDMIARLAPAADQVAWFEVELAERLAASGCPVATLDPRVPPRPYESGGFVVTLWTYYERATLQEISPMEYSHALETLHAGMRTVDLPAPHFTDRVEEAHQLLRNRDRTPDLAGADRELLDDTLERLTRAIRDQGAAEQLLHGEPHPDNLLITTEGPRFVDLETCCRGPVEFDVAHTPEEVGQHYAGIDRDLLRQCRILALAMITTWRWDRGDQFPNGRQLGTEWLNRLRSVLDQRGPDASA
ncbi:MAG: phosphotransferase [Clostridia bacterium]